ncbi:MAG: Gfo/Idh/MocA family oxidoreductase [Thermoplasmata archaeon]|nr:Gfo/Idh/MocA family oxidoreductase [Thermoplasmata archaeon]
MKVGVIGTGSMGQNHVRVLSEIGELVGIVDSNADIGTKVAKRFKTQFFPTADALLSAGVEAVSIVTPTTAHYATAKEAIEKGVNVLLEKPATGDPEKLLELSALAEKKDVCLAIGLIERHNSVINFAMKNLKSGNFGSLISAHARRVSSFPLRIRDVGVIMDLGVHDIDVIKYLSGSKVKRVFATAGRFKNTEYEDFANIVLEFENGSAGTVEVNWLTPTKVRSLALTCSDQFAEFDYISQSINICSATLREFDPSNLYDLSLEFHERRISLKKEEPLKRELMDFLNACSRGIDPLVTGKDAAETLKIAGAAIKSASTNKVIEL